MEGAESDSEIYTKYTEDLEQLVGFGKELSESYIYKNIQAAKNDKERLTKVFTTTFNKPNTFEWENINLTLMHVVATYASDTANTVQSLLTELLKIILNTVDDVALVLELKTRA